MYKISVSSLNPRPINQRRRKKCARNFLENSIDSGVIRSHYLITECVCVCVIYLYFGSMMVWVTQLVLIQQQHTCGQRCCLRRQPPPAGQGNYSICVE
jgi:hypothetical protein